MTANSTLAEHEATNESLFAKPFDVANSDDCNFYHVMDVPGLGVVGREWDLRDNIEQYLGNVDFSEKRVLDVGTASGYLTFEMERRGAEAVSFDMASGRQWNLVPHYKLEQTREELMNRIEKGHRRLQNAYWYTHAALGSRAKVYYGDVYDLPDGIGKFDVVLFGMILSHLRDPFQALYSASRLSRDTVIVTNQSRNSEGAECWFLPSADDASMNRAWWSFTDDCIARMLEVLGFKVESRKTGQYKLIAGDKPGLRSVTTFVARRINGNNSTAANMRKPLAVA